jgi:hypothetical protein
MRLHLNGRTLGRAAILMLSVSALTGCGERNALIGKWQQNLPASTDLFHKTMVSAFGDEIEFRPGTMIGGRGTTKVKYDHRDDRWFVSPDVQGEVEALPIKVVDGDHIEVELSSSLHVPYTRVK